MFTIYCYNVGGRVYDRYFRSWERAKDVLLEEFESLLKSGWTFIRETDRRNVEKGFYEYDKHLLTPEGEEASLSLCDGFFSD